MGEPTTIRPRRDTPRKTTRVGDLGNMSGEEVVFTDGYLLIVARGETKSRGQFELDESGPYDVSYGDTTEILLKLKIAFQTQQRVCKNRTENLVFDVTRARPHHDGTDQITAATDEDTCFREMCVNPSSSNCAYGTKRF